jgi:hypothetical protein
MQSNDYLQVKYCPRCKETLPVAMFSKIRRSEQALKSYCKQCEREYAKQPRQPRARKYAPPVWVMRRG